MALIDNIPALIEEIKQLNATNAGELENLRIKYLSKKGLIPQLMGEFRQVAPERKRELGVAINNLKTEAQNRINELRQKIEDTQETTERPDLTRTSYPTPLGTRHPISLVREEIIDIFSRLGFCLADGPEIEDDWHVFSSMNFPEDHPARDMQDTFFIEAHPDIILRTHTSSVQSRVMERQKPPIRVICPGRV
ncbi:MAG: phenylalanine--tRNA ligase subunit alpha, partial [Bacteroidaceae bacterium]